MVSKLPVNLFNKIISNEYKLYCPVVHYVRSRRRLYILQYKEGTGHTLLGNCLLKHVNDRKLGGRIELTGRRGRRRKQLLNDLKETKRHCKSKKDALARLLWRSRFARSYQPVVRQTVN